MATENTTSSGQSGNAHAALREIDHSVQVQPTAQAPSSTLLSRRYPWIPCVRAADTVMKTPVSTGYSIRVSM